MPKGGTENLSQKRGQERQQEKKVYLLCYYYWSIHSRSTKFDSGNSCVKVGELGPLSI